MAEVNPAEISAILKKQLENIQDILNKTKLN